MPDWTYHPLRPLAGALFGRGRSQLMALRALATLTSLPGGARAVRAAFAHASPPAEVGDRLGAAVPVEHARDAIRALPVQGARVIEVGPVRADDIPLLAAAVRGRRCTVVVRAVDDDVAARCAPYADRVVTGPATDLVHVEDPSVAAALEALAEPGVKVLATPSVLIDAGPGWFQRVYEAATPTTSPDPLRSVPRSPRQWPPWVWGAVVGLGMAGAGIGAALITLGPVLLWYDRRYLGMDRSRLHALNDNLVHFLQHDRITMAGTMIAIGVLYLALAHGMREGWPWARAAFLVSGLVGFTTLLYFLRSGFLEPLHTAVTVLLFPMFVIAVRRRPARPQWTLLPDGPEEERRRALVGQFLMVVTGTGLVLGGAVVSLVGLTSVFVGTDLAFLGTDAATLDAANPRLLSFVAHDRAGFGGALMSAGLAVALLSAWGWRRGASWVWWSLAVSAVAGFAPAVVVHLVIDYTSFVHLAPVYVGIALTAASLGLSRPYLCASTCPDEQRQGHAPAGQRSAGQREAQPQPDEHRGTDAIQGPGHRRPA